ncbi:MAG: oligosaccharide flippase family protein [Candidatus Micrarchaeia archaeon]
MEVPEAAEAGTQMQQNIELGARTAKVASSVLLGKLIIFILVGLSFVVVARLLGPSTYGIYTLAMAVIGIFGSVGDLGIGISFNKFLPEYMQKGEKVKARELLKNGFAVLLAFGGVLTAAMFLLAALFATSIYHNASYTGIIEAASFLIVLSILYGDAYSALIGLRASKSIAITAGVESATQALVSVLLALLGYGALAPILGLVAAYTLGLLVALSFVLRALEDTEGGSISISRIKELLVFSLPLGVSNLMSTLMSNISLVVLGLFAASTVIGNFGVASKVGSLIDLITGSISVSLITMFSAALASSKSKEEIARFYNYSLYLAFILITPLLFYIAALAKPFSYVAFSGVYKLSPLYIAIMAVGIFIGLIGGYSYNLMISANKVRKVLIYTAITSAIELLLLPLLIPLFKGVGLTVLLFVIAPLASDFLYVYGLRKTFNIGIKPEKISRVILANAISIVPIGIVGLAIGNTMMIPALIISAIIIVFVYPPTLVLVKGMKESDMEIVKKATKEVPVVGTVIKYLIGYSRIFLRLLPPS